MPLRVLLQRGCNIRAVLLAIVKRGFSDEARSSKPVESEIERVQIAFPAEAANHGFGLIGEIGVMPERFATMHVRQMNLDERDADARQCVPNRHARVRVRGGIDQHEIGLFGPRGLNAVDERAFVIALKRRRIRAAPPARSASA